MFLHSGEVATPSAGAGGFNFISSGGDTAPATTTTPVEAKVPEPVKSAPVVPKAKPKTQAVVNQVIVQVGCSQ